ncbi:MAG: PAS domain S-box protein, partial [Rivularia sp. (in: cyanobacteria)]
MNSQVPADNGNCPSQGFLLEIINSISDPIFVKDRQHRWVFLNHAYCEFTGYALEELIGKSDYDFFSTEQAAIFWEKDELIFTSGVSSDDGGCFTDAKGEVYVVSTKKSLFNDESGNQFLIGTIQEITASENKESPDKFQKLCANVPGMLYQLKMHPDGSMSFPYVSFGSYELLGIKAETIEAESSSLISMIDSEDYKTFKKSLTNSAETFEPFYWEGRLVKSSEKNQWVKIVSRPEKQPDDSIIWDGFLTDITHLKKTEKALRVAYREMESLVIERTKELGRANKALKAEIEERKQGEKALLRSNAMLQAQQEAAIDGILVVDENQDILSCNQRFVELWQIPQSVIETGDEKQFLASMVDKFTNLGEFINEVENLYNDVEKSIRDEIDLGDGRTFERYCAPVTFTGEYYGRVWYFRDITDRKRAEKTLLRTNLVLKAQREASIDGILVVDEYRESISYNQRFIELWQIPQSVIETGHEPVFASMLEKLENPEEFVATLEYLFEHPDESCRNEICLKDGKTFERYIASICSLTGDNYGKIFYFRDITDRKQAEAKLRQQTQELENTLLQLQRTQVQLIQSEKMSSLGQLVAGIAHEINNPVNFITANLIYTEEYFQELLELIQLYQNNYPDNTQIEEFIEEIEFDYLQSDLPNIINSMKTGAERIQKIVLSLRTFSRLDEAEFKKIDIHESLDSTLMILQNNLESKSHRSAIEVIKKYDDLPLVECYAGKLNQVFMNILNNAIDALEEGIQNRQIPESDSPKIYISTQLVRENIIQISIIDNGSGIPEENISKLFDPFFTTKPVGKGTGLGLSMSY